jgi:hypothetical protein
MKVQLTILAALACAASARSQHMDVLIARESSAIQRLVTGDTVTNGVGARVFGVDFGEEPGFPHSAGDPGYNAIANPIGGAALPGGTALGFNFKAMTIGSSTSNLMYWNGQGSTVQFAPVSAGYSFTATRFPPGAFATASVDGGSSDVAGFTIATTDSSGLFHRHLEFDLNLTGGDPAPGIYLVAQEFTMAGMQSSDPVYLVFNLGMDETIHDNAVEWVQLNLAPIPEPGGLLAAGALAIAAGAFRRMRRREFPAADGGC